MMEKIVGFVTNRDIFGSMISLNFDGSDRYKTIRGGIITMIIYAAFMW